MKPSVSLIAGALAAATLTASAGGALAAPSYDLFSPSATAARADLVNGVYSAGDPATLEQAQYFWGHRNYCWYPGGWHGPGFYWCGYAWRRGYGWGGPVGWHGWRGGGGYHGGYRHGGYGHGWHGGGHDGGAHYGGGHGGGHGHGGGGGGHHH